MSLSLPHPRVATKSKQKKKLNENETLHQRVFLYRRSVSNKEQMYPDLEKILLWT